MSQEELIGGIEAGGTSFVVSIATKCNPTVILESEEIETTIPEETLPKALKWLSDKSVSAVGIASFGPLDINPTSAKYGYITSTVRLKWQNTDLVGYFKKHLNVAVGFQTDVNAAALAELYSGQHGEISSCSYITVGGGIGVGHAFNGQPLIGLSHAEGGHIRVPLYPGDDFEGSCPLHGNCVEGMACAGAIALRLGIEHKQLKGLSDDDPVWNIVGHYLSELCTTIILMACPEVIVLGGGVLKRKCLLPIIRKGTLEKLNGYIALSKITDHIEDYIVPAHFTNTAGVVGSLQLAKSAIKAKI